jgi:ABC-type multidrug transport system fused ATPase/permease subunit
MSINLYKDFIKKLLQIFGKPKKYLSLLFMSFVALALLDMLGISLIGPYVVMIFDFDKVQSEWGLFPSLSKNELTIYASLIIISIFFLRTISVWLINNFIMNSIFQRQVELRSRLIEELLKAEYATRLGKNSGTYSTSILSFCGRFAQSTIGFFRILAESLSIIVIIILLVFTDVTLFLIALSFASVVLGFMFYFFSGRFIKYGEAKNQGLFQFTNAVQEAVYGIKEIKILGLTKFFSDRVRTGATKVAYADKRLTLFSIIPKYIVEAMLVTIICIMLIASNFSNQEPLDTIAVLSIFLVAALRLLPSVSTIIAAINAMNLDIDSINKLHSELFLTKKELETQVETKKPKTPLPKFNKIVIDDLDFSYKNGSKIFKSLSLEIKRGDFVGLIGESGQGKTTLVDLILGINTATKGMIRLDDIDIHENISDWRSRIAYLPQETFLINGTITENIALGIESKEIDIDKINLSIGKAGLKEFVTSLPDGIETLISERGLNFSGGQRQRIALARAFYSNREIIILDESTSALDKEAASKVIQQVYKFTEKDGTALIISHNEKSLGLCNRKLNLVDGMIKEVIA